MIVRGWRYASLPTPNFYHDRICGGNLSIGVRGFPPIRDTELFADAKPLSSGSFSLIRDPEGAGGALWLVKQPDATDRCLFLGCERNQSLVLADTTGTVLIHESEESRDSHDDYAENRYGVLLNNGQCLVVGGHSTVIVRTWNGKKLLEEKMTRQQLDDRLGRIGPRPAAEIL